MREGRNDTVVGPAMSRSAVLAACLVLGAVAVARAQGSGTVSGSPLDTIMNTRFWTDVPEAKDFVRQARPESDTLEFKTPYAKDAVRPRVRSATEVEALKRDLEKAILRNKALAATPAPTPTPNPAKAR